MKVAMAVIAAAALVGAGWGIRASTSSFVPPCPRPNYGVDGTMGPLFCKVDNPLALSFYGKVAPHLFALGPNASPQQVYTAETFDRRHGATLPEECDAYELMQHRWGWNFAPGGSGLDC